jgi:hypothetical protein
MVGADHLMNMRSFESMSVVKSPGSAMIEIVGCFVWLIGCVQLAHQTASVDVAGDIHNKSRHSTTQVRQLTKDVEIAASTTGRLTRRPTSLRSIQSD